MPSGLGKIGWRFALPALLAASCAALSAAQEVASPTLVPLEASAAYPNGTFSEQLAAASAAGGGPVGGSPFRTGPGLRDNWLVGPRWRVTADGLVLFRDAVDFDAILAEVEPIPPATTLPPLEFRSNFDHAAGVRLLASSQYPQFEGYELQVGYVGAEKWLAEALYELETIAAIDLPLSDIDILQRRLLEYESTLHALEVNFQCVTPGYLKPFAGVRYLSLDESISDFNRQFTTVILGDPLDVGDTLSSATSQTRRGVSIENNLIGFQGGVRLDMWRPTRRFHVNGFVSGGLYCNIVDRDHVFEERTTVTTKERVSTIPTGGTTPVETIDTTVNSLTAGSKASTDGTRVALVTEAAVAGVWQLNESLALRGGYQVIYFNGVELADALWVAPPPVTPQEDDLFLHGWFGGLEYRR
ncbi:hypothetical protein [Botrimarina sp.]|uniref:hypothetical protein n=1 Tax=Botrimarina sp. TaxID=2795802 RepID=UPI0032EC65C2